MRSPRKPLPNAERVPPTQAFERIRHSVVTEVVNTIADPWKPHIVLLLWLGVRRFNDLVAGLKISRSTLAERLRQLLADGCAVRSSEAGPPTYCLTPKGEGLLGIVFLNRQWNARWSALPQRLPQLRCVHTCGAPVELDVVCACCRQVVLPREVKVLETGATPELAADAQVGYRRVRHPTSGALQAEDLAGDRWSSLVLAAAFFGLRRNGDFEQAIGIAPNILSTRLTLLIENGILERLPYQQNPLRYEYRLTPKGLARYPVILGMMRWGQDWSPQEGAAHWRLLHLSCHEWLEPRIVCRACGEEAGAASLASDGARV